MTDHTTVSQRSPFARSAARSAARIVELLATSRTPLTAMVLTVLTALALLGFHMLLAKVLGSGKYGTYALTLAFVNLAAMTTKLGMDTLVLRSLSSQLARGQTHLVRGTVRRCRLSGLAASLAGTLGLVALALCWSGGDGPELRVSLLIGSLAVPLLASLQITDAALRGVGKILWGISSSLATCLACIGLISLGAGPLGMGLSAPAVLLLYAGVLAAVLLVNSVRLFGATAGFPTGSDGGEGRANLLWLPAISLTLVNLFDFFQGWSGTLLTGLLAGSQQAGLYSIAERLAGGVLLGLSALNLVAAPRFAALHARGERQPFQACVDGYAAAVGICTLLGASILVAAGRPFLSLFGDDFVSAYQPLVILLCGSLVSAFSGSVAVLLNVTGHQNDCAVVFGFSAVLKVVLSLLLIPAWGPVGAAWATFWSVALTNVTLAVLVRHRLGICSYFRPWTLGRSSQVRSQACREITSTSC